MTARTLFPMVVVAAACTLSACATAPGVATRPAPTYDDKMGWILRLEDARVLREPVRDPAAPAVTGSPGGGLQVSPLPPITPDLVPLLQDAEARLRRRAALAIGRVGLAGGVAPLLPVLAGDVEPEVRQMAAFALGLIGDPSAADALTAALADPDPLVQGRAAEALGRLGHQPGADPVAAMMAAHIGAGVLQPIDADDLEHPKSPAVEAVRLGLYALVRLSAYDALARTLTTGDGQPVSRWWPVAYAFQRVGDPRAAPVLRALLPGPGQMSRAFAARGLGALKDQAAAPALRAIAAGPEPVAVRIQAVRALAALGDRETLPALVTLLTTPSADPNLRLEALTALGQLAPADDHLDLLLDVVADRWPALRAAGFVALARTNPDSFLFAISGLSADPHWSVRAAIATALGTLDAEQALPRLQVLLNDEDKRVIPSVLAALVAVKAPDAAATLTARLDDDDPVVRKAAVEGLAALEPPGIATTLAAAFDRYGRDDTYIARAAALAALVDVDPVAARPALERALADKDWAVRVRAAALLGTLDGAVDPLQYRPAPPPPVAALQDVAALAAPSVSPIAYIDTDAGMIQVELAVLDAPRAVANFTALAGRGYFNGVALHRVVPDFVVQDGDPRGDGEGGPGYTIRDEINQRPYLRGTVGMALDWPDTGGSQFFITHSPQPHLDGRYTVFGRVIEGIDVVDRLTRWDTIRSIRVWDGVGWIGRP